MTVQVGAAARHPPRRRRELFLQRIPRPLHRIVLLLLPSSSRLVSNPRFNRLITQPPMDATMDRTGPFTTLVVHPCFYTKYSGKCQPWRRKMRFSIFTLHATVIALIVQEEKRRRRRRLLNYAHRNALQFHFLHSSASREWIRRPTTKLSDGGGERRRISRPLIIIVNLTGAKSSQVTAVDCAGKEMTFHLQLKAIGVTETRNGQSPSGVGGFVRCRLVTPRWSSSWKLGPTTNCKDFVMQVRGGF